MNKILVIMGIIVVVAVSWFALSKTGQHQQNVSSPTATTQETAPTKLDKAPDFHLQDYNGKTVKLADFQGKPMVINSWASWCPFCRKELPDFVAAQKEFGDNVVIIAINRQENLATAKGYTDQQGTSKDLIFLLDPGDSFYQSIGGFSMPETIFVDKSGNIVDHKRGPMDANEIRERVKMLFGTSRATSASHDSASSVSEKPASQSGLVVYDGSAFSPQTLRVKSGTTVVFRNNSPRPLWVASDPHPVHTNYPEFDGRKSVGPGETYSFTFTKTGAWGYHDHLSPNKRGEVIVE